MHFALRFIKGGCTNLCVALVVKSYLHYKSVWFHLVVTIVTHCPPPPAFIMSVGLGCDTWPTSILNLGLGDSRDFCHILRKKLQDGL